MVADKHVKEDRLLVKIIPVIVTPPPCPACILLSKFSIAGESEKKLLTDTTNEHDKSQNVEIQDIPGVIPALLYNIVFNISSCVNANY